MKRRASIVVAGCAVLGAAGLAVGANMLRHGFSVHDQPTAIETAVARGVRRLGVPADLRDRDNPVQPSTAVIAEARTHFADHCATCHGNDGKGKTQIGERLYPRAPDLTLEPTQSLSDGEIFAIIENGIRLTGMPGWGDGTAESAYGSWTLVHFIRHLPKLTAGEIEEMGRSVEVTG